MTLPPRHRRVVAYDPGCELLHHSGEVWMVVRAGDLRDDEWGEGMVPMSDDYLIRLIRPVSLGTGALRRVHADYLLGDGWEIAPRRAESALLALLGYEHVNGLWMHPDGNRLDGGLREALDEACADVELREARPRADLIDSTWLVEELSVDAD